MFSPETATFRPNSWPSLGVEIELQLVDAQSMALTSAYSDVISGVPHALRDVVKPEFMQCYVEINTGVCRTVEEVGRDLERTVRAVDEAASKRGVRLGWGATHPFSRWQDQRITPDERYYRLADELQETVVRPVTFGLHVHVGVESGDMAVEVMNRLGPHLPLLLALSTNSPFWNGRRTGLHAHRVEVLEGFPTGGLPPRLASWDDYLALVGQMREAGFIGSHREIWWDVRPSASNGTLEVRICDMPPDLESLKGLTALIQCLVHRLACEVHRGIPCPEIHPLMLRQNRWRATRFGPDADLVDPSTCEHLTARQAAEKTVDRLRDAGEELGCRAELELVREMVARPNGSERQIRRFEETGDLVEVARTLLPPRKAARSSSVAMASDFESMMVGAPAPVGMPAA